MTRRFAVVGILAVCAVYLVVQLVTFSRPGFGFDESIYLSQVSIGHPAAFFSAPRAEGIAWLASPVAAFTTSTSLIRVYLAVVSSAGLGLAYWPWTRVVPRSTAVAAAALFALAWPALFFGPEALPNIWVAFGALSAVGWYLSSCIRARRRDIALVTASVSFVAVMRPTDSLWLAGSLIVAFVCRRSWRHASPFIAVSIGLLVGWTPWIVAAQRHYGGLSNRLHRASAIQGGTSVNLNVLTALRGTDGPLLCRPCSHQPVPAAGLAVWVVASLAVVLGCLVAIRSRRSESPALLLATGTGAAMSASYLFLIHYTAARFLLPTYALLSLPVASAAGDVVRWARARRPLPRVAALTLLIGTMVAYAAHEGGVLRTQERAASSEASSIRTLADILRRDGVTAPCVNSGAFAQPLGYDTGCASHSNTGADADVTDQQLVLWSRTRRVAIVNHPPLPRPAGTQGWQRSFFRIGSYPGVFSILVSPALPPCARHGGGC